MKIVILLGNKSLDFELQKGYFELQTESYSLLMEIRKEVVCHLKIKIPFLFLQWNFIPIHEFNSR